MVRPKKGEVPYWNIPRITSFIFFLVHNSTEIISISEKKRLSKEKQSIRSYVECIPKSILLIN